MNSVRLAPFLTSRHGVQGLQGYNLFGGGGDGLGLGLDVQQLAAAQVSCAHLIGTLSISTRTVPKLACPVTSVMAPNSAQDGDTL